MRIEDLHTDDHGGTRRIAATVVWENSGQAPQEIYYEVPEQLAASLSCNPHAFLVAAIMPAFRAGEQRVRIDAPIDAELRSSLTVAMWTLRQWYDWYDKEQPLVKIEAPDRDNGQWRDWTPDPPCPAFLFSGGVDSLATLRLNRLRYPAGHPRSLRDGVFALGVQENVDAIFPNILGALKDIAHETDLTFVTVKTNMRSLHDDWDFWNTEGQGAWFASLGHALHRRWTSLTIAPTYHLWHLDPYGTHPFLDPFFGSSDLTIYHDDTTLTRFEKIALLSEWDTALRYVRVCNAPSSDTYLNCGHCEKCSRTMLALEGLGVLDRAPAFPLDELSPEWLDSTPGLGNVSRHFYPELRDALLERGRMDLISAIDRKLARERWRTRTKTLDRRYLNRSLARLKHRVAALLQRS